MVIHRTEQRPIYLHHRVRLGKTLEAFHQLGQLRWVPALNSDTNDRADRELHHFHVVGLLEGGDGSSLHQELVNTHQTADVAAGHVLNGLSVATHHQDGSICRKKNPSKVKSINWQESLETYILQAFLISKFQTRNCNSLSC